MAARSDEFRKQVNDLWKHAVDQLEDVKELIVRSKGRIDIDRQKLRLERDKLLKKLGEQTYRLANQGKMPVPVFLKRTVDRLNEVIERIVEVDEQVPTAAETGKASDGAASAAQEAGSSASVSEGGNAKTVRRRASASPAKSARPTTRKAAASEGSAADKPSRKATKKSSRRVPRQ